MSSAGDILGSGSLGMEPKNSRNFDNVLDEKIVERTTSYGRPKLQCDTVCWQWV